MLTKVLSNLEMTNAGIIMHNYQNINDVPETERLFAMIDGIPHLYTSIDGSDLFWFPLGIKRTIFKHVQIEPSVTWVVNHNLSTQDLIVGIYDDSNNLIEAQINIINDSQIELLFTEAIAGRAIIFGNSELWAASA